ncbi:MAG TPA: transglutaminaseTgpA domain-containing protein [Fimbriiglobus sp.]|nr:transglutaminaseTgpA domain-containing protein [Fimbriiglobus sp.]
MPSDFAFRLCTYLTLALSCACIGYSEWDLLPESGVLAGVVLVLLAVSFRSGGRHELDLQSANRVGLVIGLLAVGWLAYQFINKNSLIYTLPWPASLLPYLGPLLMVLMPAKLFRPKHVGDWWTLQGMALAGVGLASSMAEDAVFGLLLGLYAVAGVMTLTLFYYRRSAGVLPPLPHTDSGPPPDVVAAGVGRSGRLAGRALGWLALALVIGLPAFFLTPRSEAPRWNFGKAGEVGLSAEHLSDLTRTGDLTTSRAVAFHVRATYPDGRPKDDLDVNQRWRAYGLPYYDSGHWNSSADVAPGPRPNPPRPFLLSGDSRAAVRGGGDFMLPDLGPDRYQLEFLGPDRNEPLVLSDPVAWEIGKPAPVGSLIEGELHPWFHSPDGSFRPRPFVDVFPVNPVHYFQVTRPPSSGDPDLGPPFDLYRRSVTIGEEAPDPLLDPGGPVAVYRDVRLPKLAFWTRNLLDRLAATDPDVRAALGRAQQLRNFRIAPRDYEPVARALSAHLARSGEYRYTIKLRRADTSADPVEEFLYRTKEGHCQRFAAGLALMLRSVGVPANFVLGFRGCESEGDGNYVIRQDQAHAWVEVLVVRPAPPGFQVRGRSDVAYHWLSLDPSPGDGEEESGGGLPGWLGVARETGAAFFRNFIVGYNSDRRQEAVATARDWLVRGGWIAVGLLSAVVGVLLVRPTLGRRSARSVPTSWATGYGWFDRLTSVLAAGGYPVGPGVTPREYATATGSALAARPETAAVADVPAVVTRAFYLARYGGRQPSDGEHARLTLALDRLQAALRSAPRASTDKPEAAP